MSTYCTKSAINVSPKTMIGQQSARHHGPAGSDSRNDSNGMGAGGSQRSRLTSQGERGGIAGAAWLALRAAATLPSR